MRWVVNGLCAIAAASGGCGGGDGDGGGGGGNAAADHEFEYGAPTPASGAQATVLDGALSSAVSLGDSPSAAAALGLASITSLTTALLGTPVGVAAAREIPALAAPRGGFDDDCITITDTAITFDHCEFSSGGSSTSTDGEVSIGDGGLAIEWDLTVTSELAGEGFSSDARYHQSGNLAFGDGTISGEMLGELSATTTLGGTTVSYEMSEAAILDLEVQLSPACVIGGSLEARRVWTRRPEGYPATSTPDVGVLIEWTGCDQATIATSM